MVATISDGNPALGYVFDDPLAIAARESLTNWPATLLVPTSVPVPDDLDLDCGPTLNQGNVGACVGFSATEDRSYQEKLDEGTWAFNNQSAFTTYDWLKHGHGAYPGDGIPNVEGSYPLAVWQMAKLVGIPGANGVARKIAAYYQVRGTPGSQDWIDQQIQLLLQFGVFQMSSRWPNNWWRRDVRPDGTLPFPSGVAGGHAYVRKGYTLKGPKGLLKNGMSPSGRYWRHRQSWGVYGIVDRFGRTGEFLLPFEADAAYPNMQMGEAWKTIDELEPHQVPNLVRVPAGDFWDYVITGSKATGYTIASRTSRVTTGFSATASAVLTDKAGALLRYGGRARRFILLTSGALDGSALDLTDTRIVYSPAPGA